MFRKVSLLIVLVCLTVFFVAGCNKKPDANSATVSKDKIKVVTTIYPVYEFTRQVGGDRVEVTMLIPPGAEPHDWDPTPKDLLKIKTAKLFFYNGAGFEPVDKLLTKEVLGTAIAVEVSKGIPLLKVEAAESHEHHEHGRKEHGHSHEVDPHVWLDPEYAKMEVATIAGALSQLDPDNTAYYRENAERYKAELAKLHAEYSAALAQVSRRDMVTTHAAFGYLAKRYNLTQIPIMGIAPDAEPTPDKLASLIKLCREKGVTTIFFETLVNPRVAQTIAKETGAKLLVLNPVDGLTEEDMKQGRNYLTIMRENLANLKAALQ